MVHVVSGVGVAVVVVLAVVVAHVASASVIVGVAVFPVRGAVLAVLWGGVIVVVDVSVLTGLVDGGYLRRIVLVCVAGGVVVTVGIVPCVLHGAASATLLVRPVGVALVIARVLRCSTSDGAGVMTFLCVRSGSLRL